MLLPVVYIEFHLRRRSLHSNVQTFRSKLLFLPAPICPVRIGRSWGLGLWTLALNPLSTTLTNLHRKCCKQKTYRLSKAFRCNTYKKHRGWGGWGILPIPELPLSHQSGQHRPLVVFTGHRSRVADHACFQSSYICLSQQEC